MSSKLFALVCIRQEVAKYGHLTPTGMKMYREYKLSARELSEATAQGLHLYQQWKQR